jgi:tetratricopeptide (TPR) repeat protein/O-antigen ligase
MAVKKHQASQWLTSDHWNFFIELVLLVVLFLVPTIFDRRLGIVFSGTKVAWLRTFGVVLLSAWAIKLLVFRQHAFVRTRLDWPVLAFLLCTTIAAITSVHVYTSLVGFYGRYEGLTTWYVYGILFFITTNYLKTLDQIKRAVMMVLPAASLMSIYSIIQRFEIDPYQWGGVVTWQRVIGTIGQPNFLAAYMVMAFFLLLAGFLMKEQNQAGWSDWGAQLWPLGCLFFSQLVFVFMIYNLDAGDVLVWYLLFGLITAAAIVFAFTYQRLHPLLLDLILVIALLLTYICILYTQSRGGYLGLMSGGALFFIIAGRQSIFNNWKKLLVLGSLIVLISGVTMLRPEFSPFERFTSEITTVKEADNAAESKLELKGAAGSRGETWKSGFRIIGDYPLFGIGPEVLKMVFPRYETELFRFKEAFHVKQDRNHNETFDVSVKHGLLAFFAYLWLLYVMFSCGLNKSRRLKGDEHLLSAGLLGAALGYLIQNQFSFGVVAITSLFWVIWGWVMVLGEPAGSEDNKAVQAETLPWLTLALVGLLTAAAIWISFYSYWGDIWFKSGKTRLEMRQLPAAVEDLKKSLTYMPLEGGTISHLAIAQLNSGQLPAAIETLRYGTQVDPYNADNFFMLAKVYYMMAESGRPEMLSQAERQTEIALKIDPYYAEVYLMLGTLKEKTGRIAEAAPLYARAFFVNPNLTEPMQKFEAVNRQLNRANETVKVFEEALKRYGTNAVVLDRVARLYLERGQTEAALKLADRMIKLEPKATAGYLLRAEIYLKLGQPDKAKSDLQDVIMIDPLNQPAQELSKRL